MTLSNPFLNSRVKHAWETPACDLPAFHQQQLAQALKFLHAVLEQGTSFGFVIHGAAGSGKTHLLARLRQHVTPGEEFVFAYARLDTAASRLWRHLRRQLVESLDKTGQLGRLNPAHTHYPPLHRALVALASGQSRLDSLEVLRGDSPTFDLSTETLDSEETAEDISRAFVLGLAACLAPRTLVFCLDQVEAVQSQPGDRASLFTLGQACASLLDQSSNIALVSCFQTAFLDELAASVGQSDAERFMVHRIGLESLSPAAATELIQLRLSHIPGVSPVYPIDLAQLQRTLPPGGETVRKVLHTAYTWFERGIGHPPPVYNPEATLASALEHELSQAEATYQPALADHVLADSLPLLLHQHGHAVVPSPSLLPPPVFTFQRNQQPRHLVLLNEAHGGAVGRKLQRILAKDGHLGHVTLLRDAGLPIRSTARQAHQKLETFQSRGGQFVTVSRAAMVALEALRKLLSKADAGDLAHAGDTLGRDFVAQWLKQQQPAALDELLAKLAGIAPAPPDFAERLTHILASDRIATLESLAAQTQLTPQQLEDCARNHPDQFILLGGECPILCLAGAA